ncbi:MAG: hypothetical protein ABWK00_06190 [Desulfurococcaceae archaeon]
MFKRMCLAMGWADPNESVSTHALLCGGLSADDRIVFVEEREGSFAELIDAAIQLKDDALASELWVDGRARDLLNQLLETDGLTRYVSLGTDYFDQPIWLHEPSHWPSFRDRDTTVYVCSVPISLFSSPFQGLDRVVSAVKAKRLSIRSSCRRCLWILDQPYASEIYRHALARAMSFLAWAFEDAAGEEPIQPAPAYGNLT